MTRAMFVLRIGRLRWQYGGEGWDFDFFRLAPDANPRWAWVMQLGSSTLRWARHKGSR